MSTRSLVLIVAVEGVRKVVPLVLHDMGTHWSTGDLDLDPFRVVRVVVNDQAVPPGFDVTPRDCAEPAGMLTIRRAVESCEDLALDDESDREVLIGRLARALGIA